MTEAEFRALAAQGYNRIPLVLETFADLDTPLSLYVKLANEPLHVPARVGGRRRALRTLFVHRPAGEGPHPRPRHRHRGRRRRHRRRAARGRPARVRRRVHAPLPRGAAARAAALLRRARRLFRLRHGAPHRAEARRHGAAAGPGLADVPDILLLLTEELAVVDNLAGKISLIVYADPARARCLREARATGCRSCAASCASRCRSRSRRRRASRRRESEFGAEGFQAAVRAREGLHRRRRRDAGRALAADARGPFASSPLSLYRALRSLNPSPYMFYFDFGDFHVVGASPEILVRKEGAAVTLRPIAGTRPRGATREADEELAARAPGRPEGERRARDAGRPRAQRRGPRRADRHRQASPTGWWSSAIRT